MVIAQNENDIWLLRANAARDQYSKEENKTIEVMFHCGANSLPRQVDRTSLFDGMIDG